jgi:recombination protein RecT
MTEQTQLANRPESGMARVRNYMLSPEVTERFSQMMGKEGIYYLNQVLILVANSQDLQNCTPQSILISAMRAASLKLSVDPSSGQAWIIPYKGVATFQIGYKGVYELALRTGLYRFINVVDIYEGETVEENRMTGMHSISGGRTGNKVIARMLYFQLYAGFEKTFVMTVEEIEEHAKHYSQAYNSAKSKWKDPYERPKMERKTVLVNGLRKWGRFNANDEAMLDEIETAQGWMSRAELPEESEVTPPAQREPETVADNLHALGYDTPPEPPEPEPDPMPIGSEEMHEPPAVKPWTNAKISLVTAKAEKSEKDGPYWDMPTEQLAVRANALGKVLKDNHLEEADRIEKSIKRDVIVAILAYRAQDTLI